MQIVREKVEVKKSFNPQESFFRIGDESVVLDILRKRLYSNPIRVLCQEIASNARDANRENKCPNKPITITLPNRFEPYFKVKDNGIGISPSRMNDIFIAFGCSTKRDDNTQTGGFGLGAKSPFAYTDSFSIITVTEEENSVHVKRSYTAYIDETNKGKMALVGEEITDEATGTEIIVACKPNDFQSFREWVTKAGKFWEVKPEIKGSSDFSWPKVKKGAKGTNWYLIESEENNYRSQYAILLTIDGIAYDLDFNSLRTQLEKFAGTKLTEQINSLYEMGYYSSTKMVLEFKIGELPLTASREEVDYCDTAIKTISERMKEVIKELSVSLSDYLASSKTLVEANKKFHTMNEYLRKSAGNIKWNGKDVKGEYSIPATSYARFHVYERRRSVIKMVQEHGRNIEFYDGEIILINDLDESDKSERRRVHTLFDDATVSKVKVLTIPSQIFYDAKKAEHDAKTNDKYVYPLTVKKEKELLDKEIYLSELNFANLSTIQKKKIIRNVGTGTGVARNVPIYYVYTGSGWNNRSAWEGVMEDDVDFENDDGIYVLLENRIGVDSNGQQLNGRIFSTFSEISKEKLYGISKRLAKKLGSGFITLEEFMKKEAEKLEKKLEELNKDFGDYMDAANDYLFRSMPTFANHIQTFIKELDINSKARKYIELSNELHKVKDIQTNLNNIYADFPNFTKTRKNNKNNTMRLLRTEFEKAYPMIPMMLSNYFHVNGENVKILLQYIKQMDRLEKVIEQEKKDDK